MTQAKSQLVSAKSQLAQQKVTVEKNQEGSSAADLAEAQVNITSAQVSVDDAKDALAATKLRAPFAGTILTVSGEVGDSVSSGTSSSSSGSSSSSSGSSSTASTGSTGSSTGSSTSTSSSSSSSAFITMASTSQLSVTASIAEADIGSVKVGQAAEITLSASNATMSGTVSEISPEGTTTSNVVEYSVTIAVTDHRARPAWAPRSAW